MSSGHQKLECGDIPKEQLVQAAEGSVDELIVLLERSGYKVKLRGTPLRHAIHDYVKANPFTAVTLSLLMGSTIALLLRR